MKPHSTQNIRILRKPSLGFTLIEMMVTLSILAILTVISVPKFQIFFGNQGIKSATFDLLADLTLARSEAIKRNANVDVKADSCGGWQGGWKVKFGTTDLRTHASISGLSILDSVNATNCTTPSPVTFNRAGRLASDSIIFTIDVSPSSTKVTPRCIKIDLGGRANSSLKQGSSC
ncbi:MAG: GspH/FimT family pseudopilin [Proteobacteria bacterium]|nr:GspH/FimT family pseudopilin [Pseudomonadota bacterium]